jgi:hypothetical protein
MLVCDISGAKEQRGHGGYEWGCQIIRARALRFLQNHPDAVPHYESYKNIIGLAVAANEKAKEMDAFISDHKVLKAYGMTGAMHQFGLQHAFAMHRLGHEAYLETLRKERPAEDFYEFDEAEAFPEETK